MATHSSPFAWETPQTEEPGSLQPMGSQKNQAQLSNQTTTRQVQRMLQYYLKQGQSEEIHAMFYGCPVEGQVASRGKEI